MDIQYVYSLQAYMIKLKIGQVCKQMIIKTPTQLTIASFDVLPARVELSGASSVNQLSVNESQEQIQSLIHSYLPVQDDNTYPQQFARTFLLVKLNSLCRKECQINQKFLSQLAELYNTSKLDDVAVSHTQAEIISQIILKIQGKLHLTVDQLKNISQGNALLASSCLWLVKKAELLLKKFEVSFCLSFISLGGRQIAFIPIVHKEKNHAGQIYFAERVSKMFEVKKKSAKQEAKVQDPYSMRCSPQVHGIAYDCLWQLKDKVSFLINKPHFKNLIINGKKIPSILGESDTFSLKMDYLICSLQEIGALSFLKSERILNSYLGKNKLKTHPHYQSLLSMLTTCLSFTSKNKILSEMTNFDTCNIDNYQRDIFYNPGSFYNKITELTNNLYVIMTVEILSSIQAIHEAYNGNLKDVEFTDEEMKKQFQFLSSNLSVSNRSESLKKVKNTWVF